MKIRKKHSFIPLFYWRQVLGTALVFTLALTMLPSVASGTCGTQGTPACPSLKNPASPASGTDSIGVADETNSVAAKAKALQKRQQEVAAELELCPETAPAGFGAFIDFIWPDHCNVFHRAAEAVNAQLTPACAGPTCKANAVGATEGLRTSAEIYKWSQRSGIIAAGAVVASEAFNSGNDKDSLESSAKMHKIAGSASIAAGAVDAALSLKAWNSERQKVNSINCISPTTGLPVPSCTAGKAAAIEKINEAISEAAFMSTAKITAGSIAIKIGSDSAKSANDLGDIPEPKSEPGGPGIIPKPEPRPDNNAKYDEASSGSASAMKKEDFPENASGSSRAAIGQSTSQLAASERTVGEEDISISTVAADSNNSGSPGYGQASIGSGGFTSGVDGGSQGNTSVGSANGVMDIGSSDGGFGKIINSLAGDNGESGKKNHISIAQSRAAYGQSLKLGSGRNSSSIFERVHSAIKRNMKEGSVYGD